MSTRAYSPILTVLTAVCFVVSGLTASAVDFTFIGNDNANWSATGNWDQGSVPGQGDTVWMPSNSTLNLDVAIERLVFKVDKNLNGTTNTLSVTNIVVKAGYPDIYSPIGLTNDLYLSAEGGSGLYLKGAVTGAYKIVTALGQCVLESANNTFTGGLDVVSGSVKLSWNDSAGTGPIVLGAGDGSGTGTIFPNNTGTYSLMPTVIAAGGTGDRRIYWQGSGLTAVFPNDWVLNKDLTVVPAGYLGRNTTIELSGTVSGTGGVSCTTWNQYGGWSDGVTLILTANNTYTGPTEAYGVTMTINGSIANADLDIRAPTSSVPAVVNGNGTIYFDEGEQIIVRSNGTLSSTVKLDLTGGTNTPWTVVDYAGGAVSGLPALSAASAAAYWSLSNNVGASAIVATKSPPVTEDNYEENDTRPTAHDFGYQWTNVNLSTIDGPGISADADFYKIEMLGPKGNERLILDVGFTHADGNIDVEVQDSFGFAECSGTSATDNENLDCELSAVPGTYYIRIYGDYNTNAYDIIWTQNPRTSAAPWEITWTGLGDGVNWTDTNNWDQLRQPTLGDQVFVGAASTVNAPYDIESFTLTADVDTSSSAATNTLTLNTFTKTVGGYGAQVYPGIVLTNDLLIENTGAAGGLLEFEGPIDGPHKVTVDSPGARFGPDSASSTFSGGLDVKAVGGLYLHANDSVGTGPFTLGSGDGSGACAVWPYSGTFSLLPTVTVAAGTGTREIYHQSSGATFVFPNDWVFNKEFAIRHHGGSHTGPGGATWTRNNTYDFRGTLSGSGGFHPYSGNSYDGYSTNALAILSGTNTYTGPTTVENFTLTVNGSLANADITVRSLEGPTGWDYAGLNGSGVITFNDGEMISIESNGTIDATAPLKLDLSSLTSSPPVMVISYSNAHQATFPVDLDSMLTGLSGLWSLTNNGSAILAVASGITEDNYEENDTLATAYDLTAESGNPLSNVDGAGVQADEDWYEIEISKGNERLIVDLEYVYAVGNIDVQVVRGSDSNVEYTANSTTDDEYIDFELPWFGTYFLRLYGDNNTNVYELTWSENTRTSPAPWVITWDGAGGPSVGDGVYWTDTNNWDQMRQPGAGDIVYLPSNSTMDASYDIDRLLLTAAVTLSPSNAVTDILTVTNLDIGVGYPVVNANISLTRDLLLSSSGGSGLNLNGAITGAQKISTKGQHQWVFNNANNTFSGGLFIGAGSLRVTSDDSAGTGIITLGAGDGSGDAKVFPDNGGVYSKIPAVTVAAGTGVREFYWQWGMGGATADFTNSWVLNKTLNIRGHGAGVGDNATVKLSGTVSGTGGVHIVSNTAINPALVLAGINTFSGKCLAENGTITIDGQVAHADIEMNAPAGDTATLNGSGVVVVNDGETVLISTNGTLDGSGPLMFDLTGQSTTGPVTVVDYTDGAVANLPATLNDMLTAASATDGWSLTDTGSLITAEKGAVTGDTDTDNDGIPDWYELEHTGNITNMDANADGDLDGAINLDEYVADTIPTNSESVLSITNIEVGVSDVTVYWKGGTNVTQYLERADDVWSAWTVLLTNDPVTPVEGSHTDTGAASNPGVLYRMEAQRD